MSEDEARIAQLQQLILTYLAAHPAAVDSLRGVRQWWLGACVPEASGDEVQAAVDGLERQGRVRRILLADGSLVYGRRLDEPSGVPDEHH